MPNARFAPDYPDSPINAPDTISNPSDARLDPTGAASDPNAAPDPSKIRRALCAGSDAVANLLLIECGLATVRDGGELVHELDAERRQLIVEAAVNLLDELIATLQDSFETLWTIV